MLRTIKHEYNFLRLLYLYVVSSGESVVHPEEPRVPRIDMSDSAFEVAVPTLEDECEKKKKKGALKSPLTTVLESWLFSMLHCRLFV